MSEKKTEETKKPIELSDKDAEQAVGGAKPVVKPGTIYDNQRARSE